MMRYVSMALVWMGMAATGSQVLATPELRNQMRELAKDILANTKQQPVTVGQFSGTGLPNSNSGPGLEQILNESLEAEREGSVQENAKYEVKGDYVLVPSKKSPELKVVRIKSRILEIATGEELTRSTIDVDMPGNNTIAELLQVTATLDPKGSKEERNRTIEDAAKMPSACIHGELKTLISSSPSSLFDVELLVKPLKNHESTQAQPRPADLTKGMAFVKIEKDELYEIRIHNRSPKEVAVAVTIDGLDMFHFTQDRTDGLPNYTHQIIPMQSTSLIQGWHKSIHGTENVLSFLVTGYGQGAVSKAGITARGNVGVIHVQFSECAPLPKGGKSASGSETGFGPPKQVTQEVVSYEIFPPHDFVSIRYNR